MLLWGHAGLSHCPNPIPIDLVPLDPVHSPVACWQTEAGVALPQIYMEAWVRSLHRPVMCRCPLGHGTGQKATKAGQTPRKQSTSKHVPTPVTFHHHQSRNADWCPSTVPLVRHKFPSVARVSKEGLTPPKWTASPKHNQNSRAARAFPECGKLTCCPRGCLFCLCQTCDDVSTLHQDTPTHFCASHKYLLLHDLRSQEAAVNYLMSQP